MSLEIPPKEGTFWLCRDCSSRSSWIYPISLPPQSVRAQGSQLREQGKKAAGSLLGQAAFAHFSGGSRLITNWKPVNGAGDDAIFTPLAAKCSIKAWGFSVSIISIFDDCSLKALSAPGFCDTACSRGFLLFRVHAHQGSAGSQDGFLVFHLELLCLFGFKSLPQHYIRWAISVSFPWRGALLPPQSPVQCYIFKERKWMEQKRIPEDTFQNAFI